MTVALQRVERHCTKVSAIPKNYENSTSRGAIHSIRTAPSRTCSVENLEAIPSSMLRCQTARQPHEWGASGQLQPDILNRLKRGIDSSRLSARNGERIPNGSCNSLNDTAHVRARCIHLAKEADLSLPAGIRNRDGVPQLRDIDSDKCFSIILHGSSSCGEDRLGQSEQPSDAQCRASHLPTAGHTVLRFIDFLGRKMMRPSA